MRNAKAARIAPNGPHALGCVALRSVALWCKAVWRVAFAVRRETYVDLYWAAQSPPQAAHENIVLGTQ